MKKNLGISIPTTYMPYLNTCRTSNLKDENFHGRKLFSSVTHVRWHMLPTKSENVTPRCCTFGGVPLIAALMIILSICFYQNSPQYHSFIQENFDLVENTDRTMLISKEMPYIGDICGGDTVEGCQDPEWKVFQSGSTSKRSPCPCRQR